MNNNPKPERFQTNISLIAHVQAETFRCYQSQEIKGKQVYLNTLAVCAANSYLNLIGWSTSLSQSDSWNPISQTMMDVADLHIPGYGKLECRPVLAGDTAAIIPPEVWSGRIGYIVVMLERDLKQAYIEGFARQIDRLELPLAQLEPMDQFPTYLSQQKRAEPHFTTELSSWMKGGLSHGWQRLEELFSPTMVMSFRSKLELPQSPASSVSESRVKLIKLGANLEHTIALTLNLRPLSDRELEVSIKVSNYQYGRYLPEGLALVISDSEGQPAMVAKANETETIEFYFSGELQESFQVEILLDQQHIIENFRI